MDGRKEERKIRKEQKGKKEDSMEGWIDDQSTEEVKRQKGRKEGEKEEERIERGKGG